MQKKYYSKFTASKKTKKSGSSASSVARNTKSSYDDKPDDIGEIPWLIAKSATEGWSNEKFQTEFKRAQSNINVPRTRQQTDPARDNLSSWLSPDKYSELETKARNTYIPAQFGQRMLDNERMREYAERYQNTYIPATLAQDAIHRSGTGNDFNALTDNALRSEFLRKLDTKSMQDELDALNNDLDSNKQQYNRTKAQYASYGNNTSDNGARAAKRYIDDYESKQKRAAELERDIFQANNVQTLSSYDAFKNSDDFLDTAKRGSTYTRNGLFDSFYRTHAYINDTDGARLKAEVNAMRGGGTDPDMLYGYMSDEEVQMFNYITATNGKEAAIEYLNALEDTLNMRQTSSAITNIEKIESTDLGKAFGSAASVGMNIPKAIGAVGSMIDRANGKHVSEYNPNFRAGIMQQTMREKAAENFGEVGKFLYNTGMSLADSMSLTAITGGTPLGEAINLGVMGLGAMNDTTREAVQRGATQDQAFQVGALAGIAEALFEKVSLDNFIKMTNPGMRGAFLKNVLKQGGIEASEEICTEIANIISDELVMGGMSKYNTAVSEYIASGLTREEAERKAMADQAVEIGLSGLGGFLSGGTSGSVGQAIGNVRASTLYKDGSYDSDALINAALSMQDGSASKQLALEMQSGKVKSSNANLGHLLANYLNEGGDITSIIPSEQNTAEAQSAEEILRNGARAVAERETARMNANAAENVVQQNTAQIQPVTLDNENAVSNTNDTRKTAETSVATSDMATQRTVEPRSASEAASSLRSAIERSTDSVSGLDVYSDEDGSVTVSRNGSVLAEMDAREATAMASSYDSETNAIDYIGGFHAAYQLASEGMTINQITDTSILASDLTRAQLQAAYDSGMNASIESKRAAALDTKYSGFKAGVNRIDQSTKLSRKQRSQIRILDAIGKKYGVEIIVDEGVHYSENGTMMSRSDANGFYNPSTGRIHINLNAVGEAYLAVGMHELVHHVKNFNESGYNTLESVVLGALEERGENVDALVKYQMEHFGYSEAQAREEVVANSIPAILNDEAYVRKLVETDRTLAERIRDFLSDFVEFINETLRALEGEASWKQMRSLREDMDTLSTIAELFDVALLDAQSQHSKTPTHGERFSMKDPIEESGNLIAIHNLSGEQLISIIDLGGFPMPSIAVLRATQGHDRYGDVSVIFGKDTIDPGTNRQNKVYGGDAWTPTFPKVEYEADARVVKRISDKYYNLAKKVGYDIVRPLYPFVSEADEALTKYGSERAVIDAFRDDADMMQVFLADTGRGPVETIMREKIERMDEDKIEQMEYFVEKLGRDALNELITQNGETPMAARKRWLETYGDTLRSEYENWIRKFGFTDEQVQNVMDSESDMSLLRNIAIAARNYLKNGSEKRETVIDTEGTRSAIRAATDKGEYSRWLNELFSGLEKSKGIRNNLDPYTRTGNLRSFKTLHYEYTLDNIVRAMREHDSKGVGIFGGNSIFGLATKDYKNMAEIKADVSRLRLENEDAYEKEKEAFQERLLDIASEIKPTSERNSFIAIDNATEALLDAVRRGKTQAGIARILKNEYAGYYNIRSDTAQKIHALVQEIYEMPTEYFEAKPERAVGLDEIRAVVMPDGKYVDLRNRLEQRGVPVVPYDPSVDGDRLRALNAEPVQQLRFSLKDASTVDVAAVERENSKLMKSLALAEDQVKLTRGHRVKEGYIGVLADKALRDYSSSYDSATLKDNLIKIFKFLAKAQKPNMSEVNSLGVGLMKAVLEKSNEFDADGYNAYSDVRSYLRSTSITLSEDQRAEAAVLSDTYGKYRSSLFGSVKLTNDGLQLDTAWQELSSMNSALFPPETNASDMPRVLAVAAEAIKRGNFYTNPYGYDLDAFAADAWSNILESYFKSQTFADVKQSEIDALNQKMRDERNAARKDAKAAEREIMRNAEQYAKDIAKRDKREAALRDQILLERVKRKNRPDGKELTPMQIASLDVSNLSSTPKLAPIDASSERGGKSKFAESVDKSQNVSDEVRNLIQNEDDIKYYAKIANNETLNEANYRLNSLGEAETLRWYDARPENATALDVAEGFILLKRYQDAGDYESAVAVITKLRQMGSRAGQTVQAYSILGRLTPEAMSVYAQKELDTLRDEMVKRFGSEWVDKRAEMFQLTPEEVEKIKNTITEASKLPDGRDKNVLIASIASDIEAKLPTNSGKVIKALARNFMLLNSRTMIRNVAGNAIMMPAYVVQDFIGAGIDKALSKKTGIRTTGFSLPSKEGLKAAAKGLYESYDDFRRDINTKQIENDRFEIGNGHAFKKYSAEQQKAASTLKRQGMRLSNALNMMDRITGFLLDAGDRPFFEYHFTNSINAQIRLNNATEPTAEMIEIATSEALMRTWQDDNAMTRAASKLRNMLNPKEGKSEFGFGTLVVPFTKTPANLVKALVDYSPAGLVNALARKARAYSYAVSKGTVTATMQKDFVTSLSKGITGTLIMLLSAVLANAGLITGGDDDEDKDLSAFKKNILGIAPYSVVIDGHSYTYDWAQPIGGLMAISADLVNNIKSGKSAVKGLNLDGETQEERSDFMKALGAGGNAILNALSAGGNVMFEQSFMSGIKNLFSENGVVDGIVNSLMSSTTQFIPTALGQIAQIADPYARASYESNNVLGTTGNKLKAKIPGMRNDLAPVVDVMGNDVLSNGGNNSAFNVFLNPSNTYSERTTEAALEIYRVYQETGVLSVVPRVAPYSLEYGETYKFTAHERAQYQRVAGQTNTEIVNQLLSSKSYAALSDDQRAAVLTDATQYANAIAKEDFLSSKGVTYDFGSLSWVVKARDAENVGLSAGDYMIARSASRGIEGIKDADGNTIKNSKGLQIMSAVYAIRGFDTLPEKQRLYLFESLGVGKDVRHWNKALVEQELAKMRR